MNYCSNNKLSDLESCGAISYGEIEDYTVEIVASEQKNIVSKEKSNVVESGEKLKAILYPNPTSKKVLHVKFQNTKNQSSYYVIYDLKGRIIKKGNFKDVIDISYLEASVYVIKIQSGKLELTQKLIVGK